MTPVKEAPQGPLMLEIIKNNRDPSIHSYHHQDYADTVESTEYDKKVSDSNTNEDSNEANQNDNEPQISALRCSVIVTNPLCQHPDQQRTMQPHRQPDIQHIEEEEQYSSDQQTFQSHPQYISYQQLVPHSKVISHQHYYLNTKSTNCDSPAEHLYSNQPSHDLEQQNQHYHQLQDIPEQTKHGTDRQHYIVKDHQYDIQDRPHFIREGLHNHQDDTINQKDYQHSDLDQPHDTVHQEHHSPNQNMHPTISQPVEINTEISPEFSNSEKPPVYLPHQQHPKQNTTKNHKQQYLPVKYHSHPQQEISYDSEHQNEKQLESHQSLQKEDQQITVKQKQTNNPSKNKNSNEFENDMEFPRVQCPLCERCYKHKSNLSAHIREFHQQKRKYCPFCTKTFSRHNQKRKHIETKHYDMVSKRFPTFGNENSTYTESSKAKESSLILQSSFQVANELKHNRKQGSQRRYPDIQSENINAGGEDIILMTDNGECTDDEDNKLEIITDEDENNEGSSKSRRR